MSLYLTIDCGNTATKLVVYDAESSAELDHEIMRGRATAKEISRWLDGRKLAGVATASVVGDVSDLLQGLTAPLKLNLDSATRLPISNGYATPATLGPDRLGAAVGAASLAPGEELLVADIGTACTFDVVSADGTYLGGNIAPGVGMRLRALHHFTARLPLVNSHATEPLPCFGGSTAEALRAGSLRGVVAEICYYSRLGNASRRLFLTGGWAPEIAALLPADVEYTLHPHLVNQGLLSILHYNSK